MNELRLNPATGRLAERLDDEFVRDDHRWFSYHWAPDVGLTVEVMADEDVADWTPVEVLER